jgi:hypothetical protein
MAPELLDTPDYTYAADVYAYAVTVFSTFSQSRELDRGPAATEQAFLRRVMNGERLKRPPPGTSAAIPDPIWRLIEDCWRQAPADRPSFREVAQRFVDAPALWIDGTDPAEFNAYKEVVYPEPIPEPPADPGEEPQVAPPPAPLPPPPGEAR